VAAVMSDAGLTNGVFYGHFTSKEDLVANVLADQLRARRHSFDAQAPSGPTWVIRVVMVGY
jgi:TetR/AcrR family transcriptional regulator, transcriptional repressor for nem operon